MGNSIKDILNSNSYSEPEEIRIIKNYIFENYQSNSRVKIGHQQITILVTSSALANTLRMELLELKKLCNTDKKLLIRIGR
jgi:hypothetical protein